MLASAIATAFVALISHSHRIGAYHVYGLFNGQFMIIHTDWNSTELNSHVSIGHEEAVEPRIFQKIDQNRDDMLSPQELDDYFSLLHQEFDGLRQSFKSKVHDVMEWDANHNGYIEIYEWNRFNRDGPWSGLLIKSST